MPIYEFRCKHCARLSSGFWSMADAPQEIRCEHCQQRAHRIISRTAYHRSDLQKMGSLDPKYDQMAAQALRNTPEADPDRLLGKMTPFSAADE